MLMEPAIRLWEVTTKAVIIASFVFFTLRLCLRFASFLVSRPWRRHRKWGKTAAAEYCAICLEDAAEQEKITRLTVCGHLFHADCIDSWLGNRSTCPVCRAEISQLPPPLLQNHLISLFLPSGMIDLFTKIEDY